MDHSTSTIIAHVTDQVLNERTEAQIRALQLDDPSIHMVLRAKESNDKPTSEHARGTGPEAQRLVQLWSRLIVDHGLLKRKFDDAKGTSSWTQLVLPRSLREEVMQEMHSAGHLGEEKTLHKIKERFYWPGMHLDVKTWCQTCPTCATRKTSGKKNCAPL